MNNMHLDLRRIDLNLLVIFNSVYQHRSVAAAAKALAMSASAVSHALIRLRSAFSDELFFRVGNTMQPTVLAEEIATPIADSLALLTQGLARRPRFNPARSTETFTFSITDYTAFSVFPSLMAQMETLAPNIKFNLIYSPQKVAINDLLAGKIDFALGFTETAPLEIKEIEEIDWIEERYVAISPPDYTLQEGLTLEDYLRARHLVVTPWNEARGVVDYSLDKIGKKRNVVLKTPSMMSAPFIIAQSSMLMTLPCHVATLFSQIIPLRIHPLPFHVPDYRVKIYSHRGNSRSEARRWLQSLLQRLAAQRS
ncbi:LysR substrate-binding domain-containing protein [Brenneria populi subsp. brevivirga]|uniref:LysR substrate-binding domain-containing protein n=1 Tax=Brenneria populi TaxID=1505588 RepID=UPI002E182653|nr:LysR substrate-binding domain-containing protein [Brenneria populi subsp. brevivirga]